MTPTTPAQVFSAGVAALNSGKYQLAATYFNDVLAKNPNNANATYNLGVAEGSLGNSSAAEAAYRRALTIDPKMASALFNLADLQAATNPQAAIATLRHLLTISPHYVNAQFNLGLLLAQHGKAAEGGALLATAIAANPALRSRVPAGIKLPAAAR